MYIPVIPGRYNECKSLIQTAVIKFCHSGLIPIFYTCVVIFFISTHLAYQETFQSVFRRFNGIQYAVLGWLVLVFVTELFRDL